MSRALLEHEARQLLKEYGIPVLDFEFCSSLPETVRAARRLGFPVVLKVVSREIVHKSDAGGVKLNLKSEVEVEKAFAEIVASARKYNPSAIIEGVIVSPYLEGATELIIGSTHDPQFGPVVMIGLGGIFVEVFKDVSFGIAPVNEREATEMLNSLKAYKIFEGVRGREGLNIREIVQLLVSVSEFVCQQPIKELDLNPIFCFSDRVLVGDARILLG